MVVRFTNELMASAFAVEWDGGETDRTPVEGPGGTAEMDLDKYTIPPGTSCWARAYVVAGPNHDSGDNFNYAPGPGPVPHYLLGGSEGSPSFSLSWDPSEESETAAPAATTP
jgi:hypothetical protein